MGNPEVLRRRLDQLQEYLTYLRRAQQYSRSAFLEDPERYASVERFLHLSIEAVNDMGSHVVADEGLGTVERAQDLPDIFQNEGYIDDDLRDVWADMIGFRNVLVHEYLEIDREIVYDVLQSQLDDIERLRSVFAQFL